MSALQKWAENLMKDGRKQKLLVLIDAIPTIQELLSLGIRVLGEEELEYLNEIVKTTVKNFDER
jgi:hypothetical protein